MHQLMQKLGLSHFEKKKGSPLQFETTLDNGKRSEDVLPPHLFIGFKCISRSLI
jgi:hypothetical protein